MWINIKTEFTFKKVYGHLDQIAKKCATLGDSAGIADIDNTFGYVRWQKACKKVNIKPIYGVKLAVMYDVDLKVRRTAFNYMTFIARNDDGLKEIYKIVDIAHKQFYYKPLLSYYQVNQTTNNIFVLSGVAPEWKLLTREVLQEIGPDIPFHSINYSPADIATIDNYYPDIEDKLIYEPFAEPRLKEDKTSPMHILTKEEWEFYHRGYTIPLINLKTMSDLCNAKLMKAPMVKYVGDDDINMWCTKGAKEKGINIWFGEYSDRFEKEMKLIKEKNYVDYFLMVADVIEYAKTKMAVGPARGSSAGSLVCYLMGITEIDPLKYGLYFERFIDVNRFDLPDIDIDFQKEKRHLVLKYLEKKYGKDCVTQIGNISRMKPKSAIARFAQSLSIPLDDVQEVKDSIIDSFDGDIRANLKIKDTLKNSEIGRKFIEKYPNMKSVTKIESHASHTSVHAAGILVCNRPISDYCGINSRGNQRIAMIDKKDAEVLGLLKIDALGLRTLSILANVCDQIKKEYSWLYEIPTDDEITYKVFNDQRLNGIFQFEGTAVKGLAKQMPIKNIDDVSALGALGRPGPLASGGANSFIKYRNHPELIEYLSDNPIVIEVTKETHGVIIYQEQMLAIGREYGKLSWADTSELRRATSKTLGDEFFDKYKINFIKGAIENGETEQQASIVWRAMHTFGSWSFNKSHAISYGLISYLCAYMKAHYSLEFTVACLNNSKNDRSALKILRDAVENDGIEYKFIDNAISVQNWSIYEGKLYGGFLTLHGIGPAAANKIVKFRKTHEKLPNGIVKKLQNPISEFKYLYPAKELYGDFYSDPQSQGVNRSISIIRNTQADGEYTIIGCMIKKNSRDANEAGFVSKRGGKYLTGQTTWLNITIEDDTDSIMCKIKIEDYYRLGREIAETGKEDKDWYMVYGKKINGWGLLFVQNIRRITRDA